MAIALGVDSAIRPDGQVLRGSLDAARHASGGHAAFFNLVHVLNSGVAFSFLAGAIGNAAERMVRGVVVDFLDFHWQGAHWPAFDLADVAISLGALCLIAASG
ncbi:signal peptidase II [Azonexus hydrophilus]|jgi:lipoprotein signal peptidase|uniref:signal peptidase II n=1 Tax=Azonexus hydrophilus TaxID=418702 RepID=UPI001F0687BF|nr:signal peptidase II [Azonexus hydrophilus]